MELTGEVHARIKALCQAADGHAARAEHDQALELYGEALSLLPAPAEQWEAATWVLAAIADVQFHRGDFLAVREAASRAVACPGGPGNPFLHLRLGQAQLEIGAVDRAKDELARAFMGGGDDIFKDDDPKYWLFIREILRPPAAEVGQE